MLVSLDWLKDYVEIPKNFDLGTLGAQFTLKTAEVEKIENEAEKFENMVVGHVLEVKKHPNADKLKIAKVSIGKETVQIVCGGENLREEMYVAVAKPGAKVRWHGEGDLITLEKTKIRGEESVGMICAASEIGLDIPEEGPRDITDLSAMKPEIGMKLSELFQKNDLIIEFDNKSLTHRPDLWGHYGIARELAVVSGGKFKEYRGKVKIPEKGEKVKVEIEDFELCPRYCGLIIDNVRVGDSPEWIRKRLKATGHGIHNNIVDVTNYVMHELGQPMHAFDKSFVKGGIVVRLAKKGEKMKTLDDVERKLDETTLVIADHKKVLAIAGVMGGEDSEINEGTTSIILESANFNAGSVRKTSVKQGLRTDAVQRFEKSLDPRLAETAIRRAAEIILEICPGARIAGPISDINKFENKALIIELDTEKTRSKIGVEIEDSEIRKILESLEFEVKEKKKGLFEVTVPSFRATKDVTQEDDLIEEVVRIYGYENVPSKLPDLPIRLPMVDNKERFKKHRTRELFSYGLGFDEVSNYSFYSKNEIENCNLPEEGHVKVLNYLSEDQTHMRISLVPNILKNVGENLKYFPDFKIYEIGRTYKEIGDYFPLEEKWICGVVVGKGDTDGFYEAKGAVEAFFEKFAIDGVKMAKGVDALPYAHPAKAISYIAENGQTLAKVYSLHPAVLRNYNLEKQQIAMFEINFTESMKLEVLSKKYLPIPKFPSVEIDISVLVDKDLEVAEIEKVLLHTDRDLIKKAELFDVYSGQNVKEGKKAVAYRLLVQAEDRTLNDAELSELQNKLFGAVEKFGGEIRGR